MDGLAFWRDIALVFLLIQVFVLVVVAVAVSYLLLRVTANLHIYAQRGAEKAQEVSQTVVEKSDEYAGKARAPIVKGNAAGAGVVTAVRTLFSRGETTANGAVLDENHPTQNPGGK